MSSPANYHTTASGAAGAMRRVMSALDDNPALAVCLDFEWDSHAAGLPLQLVQVAVEGCGVHVFDAKLVHNVLSLADLSSVMQRSSVVKVLHDARADTFTLRRNLGSESFAFASLFNTQIAHLVLTGEPTRSLDRVVNHWLGVGMEKGTKVVKKFMQTPGR
jgi:helicase MOV-10